MKKIFALLITICCCSAVSTTAQSPALPANQDELLERAKRIYKAPLVEKAKITEAQADKVVAIIAEIQGKMRDLSTGDQASLAPDERMKKLEALRAERDKKFKAIPLTDDEMKNVSAAIDEIRRNMQTAKPVNN